MTQDPGASETKGKTRARPNPPIFEAYAPAEMARHVETVGVAKTKMAFVPLLALAVLAGAFIALGAAFYSVTMLGGTLGLGPGRLLGGVAFSLGLILVIVGGAELFTGNALIVMAWADRKVTTRALLRNWTIVYVGNLIGAAGMAVLVYESGSLGLGQNGLGIAAIATATAKTGLSFEEAFIRGILCNVLVCLAVWLTYAARTVTDKILAIVFPIAAFVALGFEHSVANMYFIPLGLLAAHDPLFAQAAGLTNPAAAGLTLGEFLANLLPVTLGNIVGGGVLVAATYYAIYLRPSGPKE